MGDSRIDLDAFSEILGCDVSRRGLLRRVAGGGLAVTGLAGALRYAPSTAAQEATPPGAPFATPAPAGAHHFRVGQRDLWVFDDGDYTIPGAFMAINAPPQALTEALAQVGQSPEAYTTTMNILLIDTGDQLVLIDTGFGPNAPTTGNLLPALQAEGIAPEDIDVVLLTHLHADHFGGAATLAAELGCPVAAWKGAVEEMSIITKPIADGDVFRLGGATLRALHTPGHASHHVCFHLLEEDTLFAGDVVAGSGTVVIAPPDGDMQAYLDTLHRLRDLKPKRICPGHGPVVEDGVGKLTEYIEHRLDRERQVLDALDAGIGDIPEMVKRIYADVPEMLHPMAELSVRAHLEMLEASGRVARDGDAWSRR